MNRLLTVFFLTLTVIFISLGCEDSEDSTASPSPTPTDGDEAEPDNEVEMDEDDQVVDGDPDPEENADPDPDEEEVDEIEEADNGEPDEEIEVEPEGPISELAACGEGVPLPCRYNFPFEYTDSNGEFRLGPAGSWWLHGSDVWESWIIFYHNQGGDAEDRTYGLMAFNYSAKSTALISQENSSLWPAVRDGSIAWTDFNPDSNPPDEIFTDAKVTSLTDFSTVQLTTSETDKKLPKLFGDVVYWLDNRHSPDNRHIYSVDEEGLEFKIDSYSMRGLSAYDVFGETLVYVSWPKPVVAVDSVTLDERVIADNLLMIEAQGLVIWENLVFWSDYRLSDNPPSCGASIIQYNLETDEETVLVPYDGADRYVDDVWEDWMVYSDYSEATGPYEGNETCRYFYGNGDVILRYLPTGEEWNLTNMAGDQSRSHIWDHLVVWRDERADLAREDMYGRDLCLHPELSTRFPSCNETRQEKRNSK